LTKFQQERSIISPHCHDVLQTSEGRPLLDILHMDSQSRAFEGHAEAAALSAGTPLPCPRTMSVQVLADRSAASLIGTLFTALFAVPRALVLAPAVISRSRRA
jgi:hypothetical protein